MADVMKMMGKNKGMVAKMAGMMGLGGGMGAGPGLGGGGMPDVSPEMLEQLKKGEMPKGMPPLPSGMPRLPGLGGGGLPGLGGFGANKFPGLPSLPGGSKKK
jgi:signal recognition particle subunit SRP54